MVRRRDPSFKYITDSKGRSFRAVEIVCAQCGKDALSVLHSAAGRFCSRNCAVKWRHAQGQMPPARKGAEHPMWKGAGASYGSMHDRIRTARGQADHCERRVTAGCRSVTYEWAHIHDTDPGDPSNYMQLCKQCHIKYDGHNGSGSTNAKLTMEQAREIRWLHARKIRTQVGLAEDFNVSQPTISKIVLGVTYRET